MNQATVTVFLCGGLGNQCFQVATLLAYAIKTKRKIVLPDYSIGERNHVYWNTVFAKLFHQELPILILDKEKYAETTQHFKIISQEIHYTPIPILQDVDVMLRGYYQSHLYFESIERQLCRIMQPNETQRKELDSLWASIVGARSQLPLSMFVAVHVRRGDYLGLSHIHPILANDYYHVACDLFKEDSLFVVFSDDIAWCRTTWGHKPNFLFVPNTLKDCESLYLMMCYCQRGNIIGNSSFSWWAAYIGWLTSEKQRLVVAPESWFGVDGPKKHSLHVPGWLLVQNSV